MNTFLAKYKDLALKVIYYTKKRQLGTKIFFATSKFQEVLQYFEQNLKDSQTYLKPCYLLNGKQIFPSDVLLYFCTVDPNLRLVEEDLFLEVEEFENLDDASEPIYEKLLTPSINPFKIYILNPKDGVLQLIDYPKEQLVQNELDNLNENFACCNSTDSLYISYGKNLWIISHNDYQIEKKEMPLFKEKHSMTYILSNNTVFFAGGSEDCFYYDINSKEFILWGKQNGVTERPALIQFGDFLYSFNSFNQSGIYFEKTKLTNPAKKWEKIVPQSGDQESGFFYNKSYGVSKCSGGNVLFAGGINNQLRTFKYNLKSNILFINPSKDESILFIERNFYKIDHNFNIAIPKDLEKDHVIAIINKNSKTLNLYPIEQIGINSRNNLLQLDSPANRIPGNLIIQCRYMSIKDFDNFLKSKEQKANKINSGAEKKELRPRLGNRFNGDRFRYNYRGKTPALERINEKRDEEEDEDDSRKEPHSSSNKKKRRSFDLGMKLDNFDNFNFSKKKLEDEDDKNDSDNENENENEDKDKDTDTDKASQNITNDNNNNINNPNENKEPKDNKLNQNLNDNENKNIVIQKNVQENIVQNEVKESTEQNINKEVIEQNKNEESLNQNKVDQNIIQKENKETIDNKENKENNINTNLRPKINKRNENIDINVDYNDAYIDKINEKDKLKSEELSEKKKKSEEYEIKQQVTQEISNKREFVENMKKPKNEIKKEEVENKEINNEPISNKGTKKKIKHKKIDLNMVKKEEARSNDFSSSNATTPPTSSNDINSLPKNNNVSLKINLQEEKSNKKNKKDLNNNFNINNIKATNKGMIANNKDKDNITINLNLMKKMENEDNIKQPRTPNSIKGKPKQINYNITNNNKRNNQKNIQYKKVNTPILNNINNNTNNNMNIKTNINTSKNNELKRVDSSSKNNKLHSSKNSQQNSKDNNIILKSNTNFIPYSSPHKLQKYQMNPFVDNSKYQNLGEKQTYQFKDENEQNQSQNQNQNKNISGRATKAVKSQKRKERKSCNYNTMTSMTIIDNQQVMSNDMIKFNNIKKSSYKTSTHKQIKGQRILSLENYNSVKSTIIDGESGTVFLSEMTKNVRINKKDLTPDSNRISFNKNDLNKKTSNYTDMYIKHNNLKLNQQFNGKRQNYINNSNNINVSSNYSNISANSSMRIYKTGNMLKSQHNSSSEKLFKGGNTVINDEGFKASDGKRYVMARNVKRIRREEEMGIPKGNEDKKIIYSTNDSNREHYDYVNNNIK